MVYISLQRRRTYLATTEDWSTPTESHSAYRRAGGRRKINAVRQLNARIRRANVMMLSAKWGMSVADWGFAARAAETLGVHRSTICRDIKRLMEERTDAGRCKACGRSLLDWSIERFLTGESLQREKWADTIEVLDLKGLE